MADTIPAHSFLGGPSPSAHLHGIALPLQLPPTPDWAWGKIMSCVYQWASCTVPESSPVGFPPAAPSGDLFDNVPLSLPSYLFSTPLPGITCQVKALLSNLLVQGVYLGNPNEDSTEARPPRDVVQTAFVSSNCLQSWGGFGGLSSWNKLGLSPL